MRSAFKTSPREVSYHDCDSSLGRVRIGLSAGGVYSIEFDPSADPGFAEKHDTRVDQIVGWLDQPGTHFDLPLDLRGTSFQVAVWDELRSIPVGTTTTYAVVAQRVGRPQAVRAVGRAVGSNRLAVVVPCHRVIRTDGGLGGFRWGLERKQLLLDREACWVISALRPVG